MKITIEIPEWAKDRHLYFFAGMELLAYVPSGSGEMLVKDVRCNMCGECCRNIHPSQGARFPLLPNGTCGYLIEYTSGKTECDRAFDIPFSCASGNPISHKWKDFEEKCCIRFKKEKVGND